MIAFLEWVYISDNMMKLFKHEMDLTAESLISFLKAMKSVLFICSKTL